MSGPTQYKKKLWLLGPYASLIHWVFEFIILTGLPVLAAGAAISVADLLTGGVLSHLSEGFNLVWAVGQAVSIELLFFSSFMRVAEMAHQGHWGQAVGWASVGLILAVPSFQAAVVYGQVHTFGITVVQAIARLGISEMEWIVIRALAVVFVGALEGLAAYTPEGTLKSVAEQVRELEDQAAIAVAKGRLHQARAKAVVGIAKSTVTAFGRADQDADPSSASLPDETPDEAAPASANGRPSSAPTSKAASAKRIFSLAEAKRLHKQKAEGSTQRIIFAFLAKHPSARLQEIQEATGVGRTAVAKYKKAYFEQHSATAAE